MKRGFASAGAPTSARESDARGTGRALAFFVRSELLLAGLLLTLLPLVASWRGSAFPVAHTLPAYTLIVFGAAFLVARGDRRAEGRWIAVVGATCATASTGLAILVLADAVVVPPVALLAIAGVGAMMLLLRSFIDGSMRSAEAVDRQRNSALTLALGDAIVVFDVGGTAIEASAGCETVLGLSRADLLGRSFLALVNVADRPALLKLLGDATDARQPQRGLLRMQAATPAGGRRDSSSTRHITVEIRAHAAGGEIVAALRDVTEIELREAQIVEAQRSVDQALRAKDQFLANMSHELRTPLNAIIGFSEMLGSSAMTPADPKKREEYAGIILQSGQHLLGVINAILNVSKIQSGTFSLLPEPFQLQPLSDQCCDVVRLQALNARVEIVRDIPQTLEEIVADRQACRQILINLLANAVKFTPEGGTVTLRVRPDGTALRICVLDDGVGIAEADLARLGDPFFQARSTLSRPFEGTGLGLSVVRGLVGLHGGTIAIESELGKGTAVTVRLPLDCRQWQPVASIAIDTSPRRSAVDPVQAFKTKRPSCSRIKQIA